MDPHGTLRFSGQLRRAISSEVLSGSNGALYGMFPAEPGCAMPIEHGADVRLRHCLSVEAAIGNPGFLHDARPAPSSEITFDSLGDMYGTSGGGTRGYGTS